MTVRNKPEPQTSTRVWQRMLSGRRLDLLDPSPLDIEIADIAHGLARVARWNLSLIHISEPTRLGMISYAVFCLKKKRFSSDRERAKSTSKTNSKSVLREIRKIRTASRPRCSSKPWDSPDSSRISPDH